MQLSVVIVNYNVCYFLEQCLASVRRASANLTVEVWVVDNASTDHSEEIIRKKFPEVNWIANKENVGFAKANNQAIRQAAGDHILLLNPDTVVGEDTFEQCIRFMHTHPEAGALGVQMIDGKGQFLPESKRGLPTPAVAFYKTFGLAALFPQSKIFGQYHLGYLNKDQTHEVAVLSGAFMWLRKEALTQSGLLDENFFMYGEDIDLSYRIVQAGYKNYYFADTTIIHYKGESTKKGSLNYVRVFYNAMIIFSRKHFSSNQSGWFRLLIYSAILFRGALTLLSSLLASSFLFLVDAALSLGGIYLLKNYWENSIKYSEHYYPNQFLFVVVPLYIAIWIVATFLSGGYDKPYRVSKILRGVGAGTLAIAVLYAFLPNEWRFSRAMILLGAVWTGLEMLLTRAIYHFVRRQSFTLEEPAKDRTLIVGAAPEAQRAENVLRHLGYTGEITTTAAIQDTAKVATLYDVQEIVFCAASCSFQNIITQIQACGQQRYYKILNKNSEALIGSNSKNSAGDLYVAEHNYILFQPESLRKKRTFDILLALALVPLLPVSLVVRRQRQSFLSNWWQVIGGRQSWVGFSSAENLQKFRYAKRGVLHPKDRIKSFHLTANEELIAELNYARHYSVADDLRLVAANLRLLVYGVEECR